MFLNPRLLFGEQSLHWLYNSNKEQSWNAGNVIPSIFDYEQDQLVRQQEQQMLYLADAKDTVLLECSLSKEFLDYLSDHDLHLPNMLSLDSGISVASETVVPFILTSELSERFPGARFWGDIHPERVKYLNNKLVARKLGNQHQIRMVQGYICRTVEELQKSYLELSDQGFERVVLKIPYGSSGKGLKIINNPRSLQTMIAYILRRNQPFEVLMEGWTMARSNMNGQLWIDQDRVEIVAVTEQKIDSDGVYTGTIFTPDFTRQELQAYRKEMLKIGGILQEEGYKGICGIDSIVSTQGKLYPLIEINARLTQVTYLLPLVLKLTNHEPHLFYVESVQHSFSLDRELSFSELLDLLSDTVKTDDQNKLFVSTYAAHNSVKTGRWRYRVQVLFYGNERTKVKAMIQTFHSFAVHGVENVG